MHDLAGNVTKREIKAADTTLVFTQTQTFDELSRLLTQIGANTQTTTLGYDKVDNLKTVTDPRSNVYAFAYDALNRLIKETDQDLSEVDLTLDGQGNVTTYEDPRNLQTTYVRNGFGEAIRRTSPDTGITDYVYNEQGLITQMTDARGVVTDYTYDALGRMLTKSFPASTGENVTFTYDAVAGGNKGVGQLTGITDESGSTALTWDVRGNVTSDARTIGTQSYTTAYDHDAADRVSEITYPFRPHRHLCARCGGPDHLGLDQTGCAGDACKDACQQHHLSAFDRGGEDARLRQRARHRQYLHPGL